VGQNFSGKFGVQASLWDGDIADGGAHAGGGSKGKSVGEKLGRMTI
jgi:hypothetical protein